MGNRFVLFLFLPYFEWNIHYLKIYSFPFFNEKTLFILILNFILKSKFMSASGRHRLHYAPIYKKIITKKAAR